jgi:hypothetical protein
MFDRIVCKEDSLSYCDANELFICIDWEIGESYFLHTDPVEIFKSFYVEQEGVKNETSKQT